MGPSNVQRASGKRVTSYTKKYEGYSWIKVKKFTPDPDSCEGPEELLQECKALEKHHLEETLFLIAEIRGLAALLDAKDNHEDS